MAGAGAYGYTWTVRPAASPANLAWGDSCLPDPSATALLFRDLFGDGAVSETAGGCAVGTDTAQVELTTPARIEAEFGERAPDAAGRSEYLAALELSVASLTGTAERLRGVAGVQIEPRRIVVPARAAFNTALVFSP